MVNNPSIRFYKALFPGGVSGGGVPLNFHDYSQQVVAGTVSSIENSHPYMGKWIQFDYSHIFQMAWDETTNDRYN